MSAYRLVCPKQRMVGQSKGSSKACILHAKFQCKQHYQLRILNNWKALHPVGKRVTHRCAVLHFPIASEKRASDRKCSLTAWACDGGCARTRCSGKAHLPGRERF